MNPETRKLLIGKRGYQTYCGNCRYNVKAQHEPKGWIGVHCCIYPCPHYIAEEIELGYTISYDPKKQWMYEDYMWMQTLISSRLNEYIEPELIEEPIEKKTEPQKKLNNHG